MPRGVKCRRVCAIPENRLFIPSKPYSETVLLTVEELEAVRLCDLEGLEQDEASIRMNVSRATFQRMLYSARRTISKALCTGCAIEIGGGHYALAESRCSNHGRCKNCRFEKQTELSE
ncbi:DUF134 domain-containing protein [Acetanaerobacterium elongatum]|uniref:Predicted DNA-binding protein, UPF0251 family n=1 Tax=Acetanaerobacterium elongatum TaxID=258515 RepID=A0A1G9WLF8_9FIRM|nr:DUF134 domain-containing protein [Acetanaerobacterium elongatum]SDM85374.1 Predicted DNA-binding protein, UPF0251 family [Acetanaerobacterium elongatum]